MTGPPWLPGAGSQACPALPLPCPVTRATSDLAQLWTTVQPAGYLVDRGLS